VALSRVVHFTSHRFEGSQGPVEPEQLAYAQRPGLGHERAYLEFDLGLSNVLLAAISARNLLCLRNLSPDGLGAEILNWVALDGVDAQD